MKPHHLALVAIPALLLTACTSLEQKDAGSKESAKFNATTTSSVTETTPTTTVPSTASAPGTTVKQTDCQPVPAATIAAFEASRSAGRTNVTFSDWYWTAVPDKDRSSIGNPRWPGIIVAAKVNGDSSTIALWGVGGLTDTGETQGLVVPLNVTAWQVLEFGKDMGKPGEGKGPLVDARDKARSYKATSKAEKCAKDGKAS